MSGFASHPHGQLEFANRCEGLEDQEVDAALSQGLDDLAVDSLCRAELDCPVRLQRLAKRSNALGYQHGPTTYAAGFDNELRSPLPNLPTASLQIVFRQAKRVGTEGIRLADV